MKTALTREVIVQLAGHYGLPSLLNDEGTGPRQPGVPFDVLAVVSPGYGEFLHDCAAYPQHYEPCAEDFEEWLREVADEITERMNPEPLYCGK